MRSSICSKKDVRVFDQMSLRTDPVTAVPETISQEQSSNPIYSTKAPASSESIQEKPEEEDADFELPLRTVQTRKQERGINMDSGVVVRPKSAVPDLQTPSRPISLPVSLPITADAMIERIDSVLAKAKTDLGRQSTQLTSSSAQRTMRFSSPDPNFSSRNSVALARAQGSMAEFRSPPISPMLRQNFFSEISPQSHRENRSSTGSNGSGSLSSESSPISSRSGHGLTQQQPELRRSRSLEIDTRGDSNQLGSFAYSFDDVRQSVAPLPSPPTTPSPKATVEDLSARVSLVCFLC